MLKSRSTRIYGFLGLALFLGFGHVFAQPGSVESRTASTGVTLSRGETRDSIGGAIAGRVFNDADQNGETTDPKGIGGVRVILRSNQAGSKAITGNSVSDAAGRFDFEAIRPGKYTVEIDPLSIPAKYRIQAATPLTINVERSRRSTVDLPIAAKRNITGIAFIDKDGDGLYKPGKDEPVEGACISTEGHFAVSNSNGWYILTDLPAGRIGLLVNWPGKNENTHVVLNLANGPVTNRIVNISKDR